MESNVGVLQRNIFPAFVYYIGVFNPLQLIQRSVNNLQYMSGIVHRFYAAENHKGKHIQHKHGRKIHAAVRSQPRRYRHNGNRSGFQRKQVQTVEGHVFHFDFDVNILAVAERFADTADSHAFLLKGFHHLHSSQILNGACHHIVLRLLMDRRIFTATFLQKMKKQRRQKHASQSNPSRQRAVKGQEQDQNNNGDISIHNSVDHIHGKHFHKREIGRGRCRQFARIVFAEKAQRHPFENIAQPYPLVSGLLISNAFLCDGAKI